MKRDDRTPRDETKELVTRASSGDPDAIAALYQRYEHEMVATVHGQLGDTLHGLLESVDLVQSTWKDVLGDIDEFEYHGPGSFPRWLQACLLNKIRAKGRYFAREKRDAKKLRNLEGEDSSTRGASRHAASDPSPSYVAMGREAEERLMQLLDDLPEPQRQVLILRMNDELEYDEIGRIIGKSPEATRKIYGRTLQKLIPMIREFTP